MVEPHAAVPGRTAGTLTGRYLLVLSDDLVADHDTARSAVAELTGLSEVTSSRDDTPGAHPTPSWTRPGCAPCGPTAGCCRWSPNACCAPCPGPG